MAAGILGLYSSRGTHLIGHGVVCNAATVSGNPRRARRPENVPGEFFVDHTCIDCDTCRWVAPETFTRVGDMSAVFNQPASPNARHAALQALLCCPTSSIRTETPPSDILDVQKVFPQLIDEKNLPGVYMCGYHSEKSFGATPYLIRRPEGNILIDSPRFTERLAKRIEALGGVHLIFLTHKDDVADHAAWQKRFNCPRILHKEDVTPNTIDVETKLDGSGPWTLGSGIQLIYTPGHTMGCVSLLYEQGKALFTGDHLISFDGKSLSMFREHGREPLSLQLQSVEVLLPLNFTWILPGHGRRLVYKDVEEKNAVFKQFLESDSYT